MSQHPAHRPTRTESWRGRTIAWDRMGSGPPVVLLHGTPWSSALWQPIADALATDHTVYLWDMPGYGASSKRAEDAVALRARLLHGATYASLALVDVVALAPWGSTFFTLVQQHADVFTQLPPAIHRGALEAYVQGASHRGLTPAHLAELVEPWLGDEGQPAFYRQIAQADEAFTDEVEPRYGELDEPVHVVWGAEDAWIPVDRAHRLAAAIPQATVRVLDDAGHLIQRDAGDALEAALVAWLDRVEADGVRAA